MFHEVLHNLSYTHNSGTEEYIQAMPDGKLEGVEIGDVNYGVQRAFMRVYNTYFGMTPALPEYDFDSRNLVDGDEGHSNFPMRFYRLPAGRNAGHFVDIYTP